MTAEEFEAAYAQRSGTTVEQLHRWGRYAEPCLCGTWDCGGWAMGYQWEDALFEDEQRTRTRGTVYRGYWLYENPVTGNVFICRLADHREIMARYDWDAARRYVDRGLDDGEWF